jgi:acyl-CoA reductase-like NAD-dependent aldehyde dehydrogenase
VGGRRGETRLIRDVSFSQQPVPNKRCNLQCAVFQLKILRLVKHLHSKNRYSRVISGRLTSYGCHTASVEDVNNAAQLAHQTFKSGIWSRASRQTRADVLEKVADLLSANIKELIALEVQQTGRAIREMNAQVPSLVRWFKYYAALIRTEERAVLPTMGTLHNWIDRKPLGVVAQITPL